MVQFVGLGVVQVDIGSWRLMFELMCSVAGLRSARRGMGWNTLRAGKQLKNDIEGEKEKSTDHKWCNSHSVDSLALG